MRTIIIIIISLMTICTAKTEFTDRQIAMMIPKYFARDHHSPPITRTRIYGENGKKVFHLEIKVNRNRYEGEMDYTVSAMASVCQYAKRPFDKFVVIMHPDGRNMETEKLEAKARCTIDHFVNKRMEYERWLKKCTSIKKI